MSENNLKKVDELVVDLIEKLTDLHEKLNQPKKEKQAPAPEPKPEIKLEDVRHVLAEIARDGKAEEVRKLLAKHNAKRLSEVKPEEYAIFLEEAKDLSNAG